MANISTSDEFRIFQYMSVLMPESVSCWRYALTLRAQARNVVGAHWRRAMQGSRARHGRQVPTFRFSGSSA
jgi:hypothetical protein